MALGLAGSKYSMCKGSGSTAPATGVCSAGEIR